MEKFLKLLKDEKIKKIWYNIKKKKLMRVRVDFFAEKIPILYRHRFVALKKETLNKESQLENYNMIKVT